MDANKEQIQTLAEIITKEILSVMREENNSAAKGQFCKVEVVDGLQVKTCFDEFGEIISAGAERLTTTLGNIPDNLEMAGKIDHTLLKPEATREEISQLCFEARKFNFASVCVNPTHAKLCKSLLRGSSVKVCTVIGFPLGATTPEVKVFETRQAIEDGAEEVDMVINIGGLKDKNYELVARDICGVVKEAHAHDALVKVILETALLTDEEKKIACLLVKEAGAEYVKTSTGFSRGGATVEDVALMRRTVGPLMGVKAAGGVRTREDFEKMVSAGATRIGASAGVKIVKGDSEPQQAASAVPAKSY
ncbi:MAG TPA: deoxyribose-phosphate aldolase [Anaerolineaceae bacterium]|jgi:deoxyribose-phosphate aldolase|nr:deoxyribose-phosphate aldolase [Anaerolineaceae bacterium]